MVRKRRSFSREFKLEAVGLVLEGNSSIAQVSRDLGIRASLLGRWKQEYEQEQGLSVHEKLKPEEELRKLRKENAQLRMERDILKKAAVIFSKDSQ